MTLDELIKETSEAFEGQDTQLSIVKTALVTVNGKEHEAVCRVGFGGVNIHYPKGD